MSSRYEVTFIKGTQPIIVAKMVGRQGDCIFLLLAQLPASPVEKGYYLFFFRKKKLGPFGRNNENLCVELGQARAVYLQVSARWSRVLPLERSLLKVKAVECVSREWYAMAASIEYHLRIGTNELGYRFS